MLIRNAIERDLKSLEELSKMDELIWASWEYYDVNFLKNYLSKEGSFLVFEEKDDVVWFLLWEKLQAKWSIIW